MLKLKLQHFGHLMWRTDSFEKTQCWERLRAGGEGDDRGWDGWMASLTRWTWVWVKSRSWWWTRRLDVLQSMGSQRVGHDRATELNWYHMGDFSGGPMVRTILPVQWTRVRSLVGALDSTCQVAWPEDFFLKRNILYIVDTDILYVLYIYACVHTKSLQSCLTL